MTSFQQQNWPRKFANAIRGILVAVKTQVSFWVHLFCALIVLALAIWLRVSLTEALLLGLCVTIVFVAEVMNTSIEFLSRQVTDEESGLVKDSLDVAAGGVLLAAIGSVLVGLAIFIPKLLKMFPGEG